MSLKLKKLTAATAAVFAMGAAGQVQSADLLFPYVVTSDTVTTIVSVINTGQPDAAGPSFNGAHELHYRLYHKSGWDDGEPRAVDNLATCLEFDVVKPTSYNDIQSIDLGGELTSNRGVMFKDPSNNVDHESTAIEWWLARFVTGGLSPLRGYLVVDDQDVEWPQDSSLANLQGEAFVFEFESGASWGYQAGAGPSGYAFVSVDEGVRDIARNGTDFRDPIFGVALNPAADTNPGVANIALMPWTDITTRFFITPLVDDMRSPEGNNIDPLSGDPASVVVRFGGLGSGVQPGAYNRDEVRFSGAEPLEVVCVGAVDAPDMLSPGTVDALENQGGWATFVAQGQVDGTPDGSVGMSVIKLEFNDGSKEFAGQDADVFNNAFMLRPLVNGF